MMELRDNLAAQIAASLASTTMPPAEIARRAYAVADAMLYERAEPAWLDEDEVVEPFEALAEDERQASWELEPRWSREDLAALEARRAGPGLAKPAPDAAGGQRRTG
jgi:hypothetical protein